MSHPSPRPLPALLGLAAGLLAFAASAPAQEFAPAPDCPAVVYELPAAPDARFPRLRRGLQVIADPVILRNPGYPASARPLVDAAPNIASLGLLIGSASTGATLGIPVGIRLGRVLVAGPPPAAANRRETLLWIASPTALAIRNRRRRGAFLEPGT